MSDSLEQSHLEQIGKENLETLNNENESLRDEIKRLLITISTYEDENNKFTKEKEEMMKQINHFREKCEETASRAFLKSHSLSNALSTLKQEMNIVTKKYETYKQKLTKQKSKTQSLQIKNNELIHQNIGYKERIKELELNKESLTETCCHQTTELSDIKNNFNEIQSKYCELCIENSEISKENEKLNDIIDYSSTNNHNERPITPSCNNLDIIIPITPSCNKSPTSQRRSCPTSTKTDFNNLTLFLNTGNHSRSPSITAIDYNFESDEKEREVIQGEWEKKYELLKVENKELLNKFNDLNNTNDDDASSVDNTNGDDDTTNGESDDASSVSIDLIKIQKECNKLEEKLCDKNSKLKALGKNAIALDIKNKAYCHSLCLIFKRESQKENENENRIENTNYWWYPTIANWIY